ncbi:unnamed protein product [Protopolystoma xenopodis]|uniref:Uncharacterized protein n=1 Tax=Protopolystoma xenopodis TaxID=117903 RepID=A0A3S5B484_9PLAT|nr:unnamed protein product [Protopolystoma xenopodis]
MRTSASSIRPLVTGKTVFCCFSTASRLKDPTILAAEPRFEPYRGSDGDMKPPFWLSASANSLTGYGLSVNALRLLSTGSSAMAQGSGNGAFKFLVEAAGLPLVDCPNSRKIFCAIPTVSGHPPVSYLNLAYLLLLTRPATV